MEHLDFEVEIGDGDGRAYPVSVIRSPAGEAHGRMLFPYDELALENRLQGLQIALLSTGTGRRRIAPQHEQTVQRFGQELFDSLFTDDVRSAFDVSRREARSHGRGLRVKLRCTSPELASLPWEFLYDDRRAEFLCLSLDTPLIRYLELPQPVEPLRVSGPLRILGMVASPTDLEPLDVERERQRIEQATAAVRASGAVQLQWIQGQTWQDLQRILRHGPWHIFHFVGHGGFDRHSGEGFVALSGATGATHYLRATHLGRLLGDHHPMRLAVLNSCDGARSDDLDVFSSTAATLIRRGTPAVVAMQYEITDLAAIELSRAFYDALADGLPVDTALGEARKAVCLELGDTVEWGTPVLYMRASDGVLFTIAPSQDGTSPSVSSVPRREPAEEVLVRAEHADLAPPPARVAVGVAGAPTATPVDQRGVTGQAERRGSLFCRRCGRSRISGARFCNGCGTPYV